MTHPVRNLFNYIDGICYVLAYVIFIVTSIRSKKFTGVPYEGLILNIVMEYFWGFVHVKTTPPDQQAINLVWFGLDALQLGCYVKYELWPNVKLVFASNVDSNKRFDAFSKVLYSALIVPISWGVILAFTFGLEDNRGELVAYTPVNLLYSALFLRRLVKDPSSATDTLAVFWGGIFKFLGTFVNSVDVYILVNHNYLYVWGIIATTALDVTYCIYSVVFLKLYSGNSTKITNSNDCEKL